MTINSNGISVEVTDYIDDRHQDCLWYYGECAYFKYGDYDVSIVANGDIVATLLDENDNELEWVSRAGYREFYGAMSPYIKDDTQLYDFIDDGSLVLDNNNWWEMFVYKDGYDVFFDVLDSGSLLEAIDEATAAIPDIVDDI